MKFRRLLSFKKENNKWKIYIDGNVAFYFYSQHGIPIDIIEDWFNQWFGKMSVKEQKKYLIYNWNLFNINKNKFDYKEKEIINFYEKNKDKVINLDETINLHDNN